MKSIEIDPSSIDAILITHEHTDHVQGLGIFSKKYGKPVYATEGTISNMESQTSKMNEDNINVFKVGETFNIKDIKVNSFKIPHDASDPCGFNLISGNRKISIATDIGHMNKEILTALEGSNFILLESNYEPKVLECSSYPYRLKSRIASKTGHLSNEMAGKTISHLLNTGLTSAMLGHLSKESNTPDLAYLSVVNELISNNFNENSLDLSVANRDMPSKFIRL
ncbi:putative metallo-hydrolase YycJ [compost metagenome]